ncbi:uncharacterized protein LOC134717783 [Mytilus trossulus]|uniref:uncharacterized protein LOC134717783 n=1 Tax=Mytilus trossulus TaxID=6551 RepID=UPI003004C4F8
MQGRIILCIVICLCNIIFLEAIIQVTSTVSTMAVNRNDFVSMNVQFSQAPVTVNWVLQNLNGSKTTITNDVNHFFNSPSELLIFSVGHYDFGFYDCFASDGVDSYHLELPIILSETGTPSVSSSMTSLDIDPIGQSVELHCTYSDSHVPSDPDVRWLHCDISDICGLIDKGNTLKYSGSNVTHPSLTIRNYAGDDFGTYWCQVGNAVGTSSSHMIKLTGTVNTTVETTTTTITIPDSTTTTIPDSTTTTTTTPDSTTTTPDSTTTISDSTTTTLISGPTTTTTLPDTKSTTIIPDPTATIIPDPIAPTMPDQIATTMPDPSTKTTVIPDSTTITTTTTILDSTTTATTMPDPTTKTTVIPDSKTTTTIPDSTTTTTVPDSTLPSIFITSDNETTGQCGGYNRGI